MKLRFAQFAGLTLAMMHSGSGAVSYQILGKFSDSTDGASSGRGGLVTDGTAFYGVTQFGGLHGFGCLYSFTNAALTPVSQKSFTAAEGTSPSEPLLIGKDNRLYGPAQGGANAQGVIFAASKDGSTYVILHNFAAATGESPLSPLVQTANGRLYGEVYSGGSTGFGGIFAIDPNGANYQVVQQFTGTGGTAPGSGAGDKGGLLIGADGLIYGIAPAGGASDQGVIFRMNPDGSNYQVLHTFTGAPDGSEPSGALIQGSGGRIFGVTNTGGTSDLGTVYGLDPGGTGYQILHSFNNEGGKTPFFGLTLGADGFLYGETFYSDTNNGIVYRLPQDGSGFVTLHAFAGGNSDGAQPDGPLLQSAPNVFRGVTNGGDGTAGAAGAIYQISAPVIPPTVKISHTPRQVSRHKKYLELRGVASDDFGVTTVEYNTGKGWQPATGTTNWAAKVRLRAGSKTTRIQVRARDDDGVYSAVAKAKVKIKR